MIQTRQLFVFALAGLCCMANAASAQPAHVILIRHGEKDPSLPNDPNGNHLSLMGEARAAALVPYLLNTKAITKLGKVNFLFAQKPNPAITNDSVRPIQTLKPFEKATSLKIQAPFIRDDYQKLADELLTDPKYKGKVVLVCWEHDKLALMAGALVKGRTLKGRSESKDWKWTKFDAFDRTWVLSFHSDTKEVHFHDHPQRLMFGDTEK